MPFLETKDKRKSAALTTVIAVLIVFLIFNFGMTYFDPPKEYGIAVNFGTNDFGSGNVQPKEALKPAKQEIVEEEQVEEQMEEEVVEEQLEESAPVQNDAAEDVITQNNEDAIAIKKKEEAKKKKEADRIIEEKKRVEKERLAEVERKKAEEKKRAEEERKAKEAKRKGVNNIINKYNNNDGKADGGEGDDNKAGDKGQFSGDPYAFIYFGEPGTGSGGVGYGLKGRGKPTKKKFKQNCNESGRVIVKIVVDKSGKVIEAEPGVKGTTSTAKCLLDPAKKIALSYKWRADSKAPTRQIGFVIVNFNLGQ